MIPKTLMGLLGLMIFVGYLVALLFNTGTSDNMFSLTQQAQSDLLNAKKCIVGGNSSNSNIGTVDNCQGQWFGAIGAFFTIIFSIISMTISFIAGIFVSFATFISVLFELPLVISQLFIALVSIGLILAILSRVIEI